jgi:putative restriction endonuclease
MKFYVGVTDNKWFEFLAGRKPDEVNFWRPGGTGTFKAIPPGAPFLFKLHSPHNFIAGGGYFVSHSNLPLSLAWEAFGVKNGASSIDALRGMIAPLRRARSPEHDPVIGCTILANPFFFDRPQWIPAPSDWAGSIQKGKNYITEETIGARVWTEVREKLRTADIGKIETVEDGASLGAEEVPRYGAEFLTKARLGQGAFRVLVTDAYIRRCAITGERTLPALEAAHIKPYALSGPHQIANGLLLRSDLHKLFDLGYITVTPSLVVEVSRKIKEKFENGRDYYALQGKNLTVVPFLARDRPSEKYLDWHNKERFLT